MSNEDFLPQLTGSFAMPAAENPTVAMVEAAYRHHGLHFRYINCEVQPESLADAVKGAKAMGWTGFNCSIPHKVNIIQYLDQLGNSAKVIGAVNTIWRKGNEWIGENTDGRGFVQAMKVVTSTEGKKILIFGAGGAARAVAVEMALAGVSFITIVNRDEERGESLVNLLNTHTSSIANYLLWNTAQEIPADTDIVINATSIGLFPNIDEQLNINFDSIKSNMIVADGIHNPPATHFLKEAKSRGCVTVDGLQMLVNQGVIGIKYWTGTDVNPEVMRNELKKVLPLI
jgi:shikimate dehydrogenase